MPAMRERARHWRCQGQLRANRLKYLCTAFWKVLDLRKKIIFWKLGIFYAYVSLSILSKCQQKQNKTKTFFFFKAAIAAPIGHKRGCLVICRFWLAFLLLSLLENDYSMILFYLNLLCHEAVLFDIAVLWNYSWIAENNGLVESSSPDSRTSRPGCHCQTGSLLLGAAFLCFNTSCYIMSCIKTEVYTYLFH